MTSLTLNRINKITLLLNDQECPNKSDLRSERSRLIKDIWNYLDDDRPVFLMPMTDPPIYIPKRVTLVGNAYDLLDNEYGSRIDNSNYVIRFNSCVTDGYQKHVGSKTDMLFCPNQYFNNVRPDF